MGFLRRFIARWSAPSPRKVEPPRASVVLTPEGFSISGEKTGGFSLRWTDIREVVAFKYDNWSYDEIIIGFRTKPDGGYYEVSEEYEGYQALVDELPLRFPGIRTDWWSEVAIPAFAKNWTVLWVSA